MSAKNLIVRLWKEEEGATLIEYGLIVAFVAVAGVAVMTVFGGWLQDFWGDVTDAIDEGVEGGFDT